ncbi:MAG: GMC oxidoreductase [Saprospiraceae bacterium]
MIKNGINVPKGSVLQTQVCIVGTGPAGITLAYHLQKAGIDVILLEGCRSSSSNDQESWADKVLLYNGEATGLFAKNEPEFLIRPYDFSQGPKERERTYGGTSTHWGGQSRPYDPVDLGETSPAYPGWPITREDLDPFYAEASSFCNLHGDYKSNGSNFDADYWAQVLNASVPKLEGFDTEMYQFFGPDFLNFATRTFEDNKTIGDLVQVIVNATLLNINHDNGVVNGLTIGSMEGAPSNPPTYNGHSFTIKADAYVMAMGAVANARQLLLAKVPNDNIGKYFMCHPVIANYLSGVTPINVSVNYLTTSEQNLMSGNTSNGDQWTDSNGVTVQGRFIPDAETTKNLKIGRCWFWGGSGGHGFYFEQALNPNSYITLSDKVDKVFGQQEVRINWDLSEDDENSYNQVTALFQAAVKKINPKVVVTCVPWEQLKGGAVVNGHHLGTTRMSNTAADGVVNPDLRSHDLNNLYIAGSSVWPSAGISNPTFTIITLSIRLADHLTRTFSKETGKTPSVKQKSKGGLLKSIVQFILGILQKVFQPFRRR